MKKILPILVLIAGGLYLYDPGIYTTLSSRGQNLVEHGLEGVGNLGKPSTRDGYAWRYIDTDLEVIEEELINSQQIWLKGTVENKGTAEVFEASVKVQIKMGERELEPIIIPLGPLKPDREKKVSEYLLPIDANTPMDYEWSVEIYSALVDPAYFE